MSEDNKLDYPGSVILPEAGPVATNLTSVSESESINNNVNLRSKNWNQLPTAVAVEGPTGSNPSSDDVTATREVNTKNSSESNATSDPLQVAAQHYPWMYMMSTLDACFKDAEQTAEKDLKARSAALDEEESEISDQRVRYEAEKAIEFYDELASDKFAKEAPRIMQTFLSHGEACSQLESEALAIASRDLTAAGLDYDNMDVWLKEYNVVLDRLGTLLMEAFDLESAILRLTVSTSSAPPTDESAPETSGTDETDETTPAPASFSSAVPETSTKEGSGLGTKQDARTDSTPAGLTQSVQEGGGGGGEEEEEESSSSQFQARSQIAPVFSACLPIIRGRMKNIGVAQELVEGAKQNLSVTLYLESLSLEEGKWEEGDEDED